MKSRKHHPELSRRKTLTSKPLQIAYGQSKKQLVFMFPKRHFGRYDVFQYMWIHAAKMESYFKRTLTYSTLGVINHQSSNMIFGQVPDPSKVDFTLPTDHPQTKRVLGGNASKIPFDVYVGCAKWNKTDLKGFYPKGTKDELAYYSTQFNSIELNATFYNAPSFEQVETWRGKTPEGFKFFPKLPNTISHFKRLIDVKDTAREFCDAISLFEHKLGMCFLQMHDNFKPKDFSRVETFVKEFSPAIPLGLEVRNGDWFSDAGASKAFYELLESHQRTNIIVDTAGRRDMLHMRLTSPIAFIRYVGANHESDYQRLDDWLERIKLWREQGLEKLYFFVHQNVEKESPLLSAYFIKKMNKEFGLHLTVPKTLNDSGLFS